MNVYIDDSSEGSYYSAENGEPALLYKTAVFEVISPFDTSKLASVFKPVTIVSVYKKGKMLKKVIGYHWCWGDHYRDIYGISL